MDPDTVEAVRADAPAEPQHAAPAEPGMSYDATEAAGALPEYLVRHYTWAYLHPFAVWFFDRQPVINAILLGNYRRIMHDTIRLMQPGVAGRTLQIAAAYGELAPTLASHVEDLHLIDAAPIQLEATARKLDAASLQASLGLMNAEYLTYDDDSFDTAVMFLLLHELPPQARRRSLFQALRVLRPRGRLVIADFGEYRRRHPLHRFGFFRWVFTRADPFLDGFWREDLDSVIEECAEAAGKRVESERKIDIFGGFYRVVSYCIV